MKRNLLLFAATAAAIALAVSCNKQQIDSTDDGTQPEPAPSETYVSLTFKAEYPATLDESKTTIADDGTVSWKKGNVITLYYLENGIPASAPATAMADGHSVEFKASIPKGIEAVYAAYPAETGEIDVDGVFKLKTNLTQNGSFEQANFAAAWAEVSEDMVLKFKNAVGLFKVQLPSGGVISHNGVDHVLRSLTIAGKGGANPCWGDLTVTADESGEISFSEPENANGSVYIKLDETTRTQGYVYLHSLPFSSDEGIVIRYRDEDELYLPAVVTKDGKAVTLERGHIKPVNASYDAIVWDWYFTPDGTGNGKSVDTPAGLEAFQTLLNSTSLRHVQWQLNEATLHLANGTYTLTESITLKGEEQGVITIEGEDQKETIIHGNNERQIMVYKSAMDLSISNLRFVGADSGNGAGAALNTTDASGKLTLDTVTFYYNNTSGNGAGILLTIPATINNCIFNQNKGRYGGAITIPGTTPDGTVIDIVNSSFLKNEATSAQGGAMYIAGPALVRMDHCSITSNNATTGGGAISLQNNPKLFVNRTLFAANRNNTDGAKQVGVAIHSATAAAFACYNCTFNDNSVSSGSTPAVCGTNYIVANSTFVEGSKRNSYGVISNVSSTAHTSTVANNIVIHSSTNNNHVAIGFSAATDIQIDCGYNLLCRIKSGFTPALNDNTSYSGDDIVKDTFGFTNYDTSNFSYAWNGDVSSFTSFSKATLSQVEYLIKANTVIGNDFWTWLGSDALKVNGNKATEVDIRGVKRTSTAFWPGSYQQD